MNHEVRLLFHELVELTPRERQRIYRTRRIGAELRSEVESLLSFDSTKFDKLHDVVSTAAGDVLRSVDGLESGFCGPYRLVRLLGSGGMGAVYLAERTGGEIQQKVAVKLLRGEGHRPGWRERFLRERQLLASLNHPSIVHVVDAGHTEDGRPYLVMEYVEGLAIDVHAAGISTRRRLELFLQVCDGVSHAHRRLIIHRDLKPSNILVDSSGRPKLLDFGIARLLDETRDATQTLERLLTPNYASPEQLAGAAQTTTTDVYSLGAVLYKLLAGVAPRETLANTRNVEITAPSVLNSEVPKDVDFIVRKALRTEPEERYLSVDEFANDVRAALGWRPVRARSGDLWYRARRFLRCYWVPASAAILVMASLSFGLYMVNRERSIAQQRFMDVRQLANKLFDIDAEVARLPGATTTRQLIVDTSLEYLRRVASGVQVDPDLALEVGSAYMRLARVQMVNTAPNAAQPDQADQTAQKAEALVDSVVLAQPANRLALLRSAQIAHDRMLIARQIRPDDALRFAQQAAQRLERYLPAGSLDGKADREEAEQVLLTQLNVGNQLVRSEHFDEAIRISRRTIESARAAKFPVHAARALLNLALAHRAKGELDEALQSIRESVRILEPPAEEGTADRLRVLVSALTAEGQILGDDSDVNLGWPEEAIKPLQRAFAISEEVALRHPNEFRNAEEFFAAETALANVLTHTDPHRALEIHNRMLQRLSGIKDHPGARRDAAAVLAASTYPLRQLDRNAEARRRLDRTFETLRELNLYPAKQIFPGTEVYAAVGAQGEYEAGVGNTAHAAEIYRGLLDRVLASKLDPETRLTDAVTISKIYCASALAHHQAGLIDQAHALRERRRELWRSWSQKLPANAFIHRQLEAAQVPWCGPR
ncbi:MAG: serine/threonine-protein kinase [Bryobacteraceae bacterium]